MYSKVQITGTITLKTGMHIGASDGFSVIGSVDSPVTKDSMSRLPYIPGSTLKGKIRRLVAKSYSENGMVQNYEDQDVRVTRLFGTSADKKNGNPAPSRLIFSDTMIGNIEELKNSGIDDGTEVKEENRIHPITAVAMPRQIERVVRGAKFPFSIVYNVENKEEFIEDMETLALGLKLLEYDYIGGHGTRGYGRVSINDVNAECVVGNIDEAEINKCNEILRRK